METISNTIIKWTDFPETVGSARGHKTGEVFEAFLSSNYAEEEKIVREFSLLFKFCLVGGACLFGIESTAYAADTFDIKATELYTKFIRIAQIIIAFKGGWDVLHKALKEDFDGAKKIGFQYLIVYGVLLGLPHGLKLVEKLFTE